MENPFKNSKYDASNREDLQPYKLKNFSGTTIMSLAQLDIGFKTMLHVADIDW